MLNNGVKMKRCLWV